MQMECEDLTRKLKKLINRVDEVQKQKLSLQVQTRKEREELCECIRETSRETRLLDMIAE